ncbi:unnamed protein product [Blepharisma stoltei]|uniref:Uncharacterized protein n=1 Tax=Blepharisma stoltei TaxID=1481888 RepID=A0AAU9K9Q9_9CILI|nr:unnamed protein product [Blepharisma stoltei]
MTSKKGRFTISNLQDSDKIDVMTEVHSGKDAENIQVPVPQDISQAEATARIKHNHDKRDSLIDSTPPYLQRNLSKGPSPMNRKLIDKEVSTDIEYYDQAPRRSHDIRTPSEISRHHDCDSVPIPVMLMFQDTLSTKFSEMLNMHKELMLKFINKDAAREDKIKKIVQDIADLARENSLLQAENHKLKDSITSKLRDY